MTSSAAILDAVRQSTALWCALAVLGGAAGCRTVAPQPAPQPTAERTQPQPDLAPSQRGPDTSGGQPDTVNYVLHAQPRFVVTPGGGAYLVIADGPLMVGSRLAWTVAYFAAPDRGAALAAGADERLRDAADEIFRAQQSLAELSGAELFSVTAIFGSPGERGVSMELTYARGADAWHPSTAPASDELAATPMLPPGLVRDPTEERSAVEVAMRFLGHVDQHEFDAAWDLSSAVVKATMSRVSFERQLAAVPATDQPAPRREAFHSFPPGAFIPGASLEIVFERPRALEALLLRMDDDMSWHVAALRTYAPSNTETGAMTVAGNPVNGGWGPAR